jgi:acyl dehydratase
MAAKRFPVEAGHIMMFARSIGDDNPVYFDEEAAKKTEAGGVIAPPTFVQASAQFDPDYFLRPKVGQAWFGSGRNPTGIVRTEGGGGGRGGGGGGGGLHAEQHYEYHRPLRAGDVLTATTFPGKTWEKEGRRSGKLVFSESVTEYRDQKGELVVTARGVGVRTERPVEQPAAKKEEA